MYVVVIRKNTTGEERPCVQDHEWHESSEFWWTDGNMGCDCNRHLEFERAGGVDLDLDDTACGAKLYSVVEVVFPDGDTLIIED